MIRCNACKRKFPDHLVQPMLTIQGGKQGVTYLCPICAFESINLAHGINRTSFSAGSMSQKLLEEARAWIEKKGGKAT